MAYFKFSGDEEFDPNNIGESVRKALIERQRVIFQASLDGQNQVSIPEIPTEGVNNEAQNEKKETKQTKKESKRKGVSNGNK